jgi:ankyrin repeat protein
MDSTHAIEKLAGEDSQSRIDWIQSSQSLTLRALASPKACEAIGMDLLLEHVRHHISQDANHSWSSTNNALLALLSGQLNYFHIQGGIKDKERWAINGSVVQAANQLVKMGYEPLQGSSSLGGADALDYALMLNATELVEQWAPEAGDISTRTLEGLPWIHVAAACGMREMTKLLVSMGVDPNMRDKRGNTPMFRATNTGMVECLRALGCDPSLRNNDKIDALTYMRSGKQRLEGEQLRLMTRALGERKPPENLETAIAQFETLVHHNSGTGLINEAKNLNLPANITFSDGKTLLGQAVHRYLPAFNMRVQSRDRNKASGWVSACSQWQEAMQHATHEDVGALWVIGEGTGHEKWKQSAKAEFKRRGLDPGPYRQQAAIWVTEAVIAQAKASKRHTQPLNPEQTERLIGNMLCYPSFPRSDLLVWGLELVNRQGSSPPPDLADAISRQPDDWQGWKQPGVIKELVVATLSFPEASVHNAEDYACVVGRCLKQGGVISTELQDIINDYASAAAMPLLSAQIEKSILDAGTIETDLSRKTTARL